MPAPDSEEDVLPLVDSPAALAQLCARFADAPRLAVDTEFVREKYYYPRLELAQISDGKQIALIDVPAAGDLKPLAKLLANPRALKIFHASDQDLEVLQLALGIAPLPIFDTQVAAALLGYGHQISLSNLVRMIAGVTSGTTQSVSDWTHRPFSPEQLVYAAADVRHLHLLHDRLTEDLKTRGRTNWYEDEQKDRVQTMVHDPDTPDTELYRRVKDWSSLSRRELAVLRELAIWRENTARQRNLPRRTIFTDEGLLDLARFQPDNRAKAQKLRRLNPGQFNRYFDELMVAIKKAQALPSDEWPEKPVGERQEIPTGLLELCQALLRTMAERHDIAPTVLATSGELQQLILHRTAPKSDEIPLLHGWRYEVAGRHLVALLQGRMQVVVGADGNLVFTDREGVGG